MLENNPPAGDKNSSANSQYPDSKSALFGQVWNLAAPAFLALIAPALFVLIDAAVIGRLGTVPLASLAAASSIFSTVIGLSYFLLTQTTSLIAQSFGQAQSNDQNSTVLSRIFLTQTFHALFFGLIAAVLIFVGADFLVGLLGVNDEVRQAASGWLRIISFGFPAAFFNLVATAYFRGQRNNQLPLRVVIVQVGLNAVLVVTLVLGLGFDVHGSAISTLIAELVGAFLFLKAIRNTSMRFNRSDFKLEAGVLLSALPLIWRSIVLRFVLTGIAWLAAGLGTSQLAAFHLSFAIWMLLALSLDALAIAAQVLVGNQVGAENWQQVNLLSRLLIKWSLVFGVIQGGIVIGSAPFVANFFAPNAMVAENLLSALVVIGIHQPLAAFVFLLDGVLLGWGDNAFMAKAQTLAMFGFIPAGYLIWQLDLGLTAIWGSVIWWLAIRAGLLWVRNQKLNRIKRQLAS